MLWLNPLSLDSGGVHACFLPKLGGQAHPLVFLPLLICFNSLQSCQRQRPNVMVADEAVMVGAEGQMHGRAKLLADQSILIAASYRGRRMPGQLW